MADRSINQLDRATVITDSDLFVLQQSGTAKSLTGQTLIDELTDRLQAHGGITSITKTSTAGLVDTYTITYADSTYTTTFTVTNGEKGDTGDPFYVHIRYSVDEPTQDMDLLTTPNNWIGIYSGTSETAPTSYTAYQWYKYKGEKGDKGDPTVVESWSVTYQAGESGTSIPSGTWLPTIPTVAQGAYLWTRTTVTYDGGDGTQQTTDSFSVARMGMDGAGSVSSVNGASPDANGNVELFGTNITVSDSDQRTIPEAIAAAGKVDSVNGAQGNVILYGTDININGTTGSPTIAAALAAITPVAVSVTLNASGWVYSSVSETWTQTVVPTGVTLTNNSICYADLDMSSATAATAEDMEEDWGLIGRMYVDASGLHAVCYGDSPIGDVPIILHIERV